MIIDDGRGRGYSAQVDTENRLATQALTETQVVHHAHAGQVYSFTTGMLSLTTTGSFSGLWYVKNTSSSKSIYIDLLRLSASVICDWQIVKNPTTGTLITSGTATDPVVTRFDSGQSVEADFKVGGNALTITDGIVMCNTAGQTNCGVDIDGIIIVTPNTTLGIQCRPSASCTVAAQVMAYVAEDSHK